MPALEAFLDMMQNSHLVQQIILSIHNFVFFEKCIDKIGKKYRLTFPAGNSLRFIACSYHGTFKSIFYTDRFIALSIVTYYIYGTFITIQVWYSLFAEYQNNFDCQQIQYRKNLLDPRMMNLVEIPSIITIKFKSPTIRGKEYINIHRQMAKIRYQL